MTATAPAQFIPRVFLAIAFRLPLLFACCLFAANSPARAQEESRDEAEAPVKPLTVWLPAPLISDESADAFTLLIEHAANFSAEQSIPVAYRIKDVGQTGGIMSSIRTGSEVAPGTLPDLALIRRGDFTPTQARQYMVSMETLFSSSLISSLGDALEFGQISHESGKALYGLPYFYETLQAVATNPLAEYGASLRFEDVLSAGASLLFPAARATGLNQTFYLQYLVAGGSPFRDDSAEIDEAALLTVLGYYQQLVERGLISPDVLTYHSPADYQTEFISRATQPLIAVFTSSQFLEMLDQQDISLQAASIPTHNGGSLATIDGWLWVIITSDQARQTLSARFLDWMTEPSFHAAFAKALYQLPTQPAILPNSLPENVDPRFYADLLNRSIPALPESEGGSAPRLMQEALIQVLHGEASASSAARQALDQLSRG